MIGTTLSHYRIVAELGRGGMGVVYRAEDTQLGRTVAIKVLPRHLSADDEARVRFVREAQTASALDHPSICTIHHIGQADDGSTFMVMPFYDGRTIRDRLESGPLHADEVRRIGAQIADGLAAAHAAGIVHRDVKPANVIVTTDGRAKILDFGVAKMAEGVALTQEGSTVGTAFYMSPEQARGGEVTERSDLWSLGVVLYEMLTGRRPFRGDYDAAAAYAIINEEPEPLPADVPDDLEAIIRSLLRKDPDERTGSAAEVREALGQPAAGAAPRPSDRPSRRALAAAAILAVAAVLAVWMIGRGDLPPGAVPLDAIVVLPFDIQAGPDLADQTYGMVYSLSPMLDGVAGIRAVDPKAVLGLVEQRDDRFIDPGEGREIAAQFGAARFILGSISRLGSQLQLSATLYDADGDIAADDVQTAATEEDLLPATSRLMVALMGAAIEGRDSGFGSGLLGQTESFPAMKAYVQASEAYRAGRFEEAIDLADVAIGHDTTFAAALNLAASARAQLFRPLGDLRQRALRHAGDAPRLREYIEIRIDSPQDEFQETMERMRSFLERYPDDIDALGYVADQTFHQNARYGRSDDESIPLFLRVLKYDPDNGEYLYHIAPLLYRERRFETLDSLYHNLSGRVQLEQLETLALLRHLAMLDREAALDSVRLGYGFNTVFSLVESHDIEAAQIGAASAAVPPGFPAQLYASMLGLVRGQADAWRETLDHDLGDDPDARAALAVMAAMGWPYIPLSPDSLASLQAVAAGMSENPAQLAFVLPQAELQYPDMGRDASLYVAARIAERSGDEVALREALDELAEAAAADGAHWLTLNLWREVEARVLMAEGHLGDALAALERIQPVPNNLLQGASPLYDGFHARFLRARIFLASDRPEEAIQWSQSVHESAGYFAPSLLPLTYQLEAAAHEQLGEWDRAVERYERLLTLWKDADPVLQPQIDEVIRRRDQALGRLAEEG